MMTIRLWTLTATVERLRLLLRQHGDMPVWIETLEGVKTEWRLAGLLRAFALKLDLPDDVAGGPAADALAIMADEEESMRPYVVTDIVYCPPVGKPPAEAHTIVQLQWHPHPRSVEQHEAAPGWGRVEEGGGNGGATA